MINKFLRFLFPLRDPVCRNRVSKDSPFRLNVDGKTYFFDSQACLATFKNNYGKKGNRKKTFLENLAVENKNISGCCNGFACGDVTDLSEKRIIIAAGDGAKAALNARKFLLNH